MTPTDEQIVDRLAHIPPAAYADVDGIVRGLMTQEQADEDGARVLVSREAIDYAAALILSRPKPDALAAIFGHLNLVNRQRELITALQAEVDRLRALVNSPELHDFAKAVVLEAAHQRERWGAPHDRSKSAENWYWLVGYLTGKALRAAITGDRDKARHHTISSAAALANWHAAITADTSGSGIGVDADLAAKDAA